MVEILKNLDKDGVSPMDGVSLDAQCVISKFRNGDELLKSQEMIPVNVHASVEDGVFSISIREREMMVTMRLDEAMAVLAEATKAARLIKAGKIGNKNNSPNI